MAADVEDGQWVDALIVFATEFGVDSASVVEKLREIRGSAGTLDADNTSDTTLASVASKAPKRKKVRTSFGTVRGFLLPDFRRQRDELIENSLDSNESENFLVTRPHSSLISFRVFVGRKSCEARMSP